MKTIILFFCIALAVQTSYAQKDVYFKLNHLLGTSSFAFNQTTPNDVGSDFQITRLQYYVSNIILHHDGIQTPVSNTFILVDASTTTNVLLGNFNITALDSISFGIGIENAENHLDPTLYAASDPLAPQAPSMHWGWTSGYRFVALEGLSGISMSDVFQMHALGDINYQIKTIVTSGNLVNNDLEVAIDADYAKALGTIDITGGVISHGENGDAKTVLTNFNTSVFSNGSMSVPVTKLETINVSVYPNPVPVGQALQIEVDQAFETSVEVYDLTGKVYKNMTYSPDNQSVRFMDSGWYILNIKKEGKIIATQKISVTNE
ncbi:MAG: T9SS type A sorting domain-containing protein [Aureispira sp.]|nr:T9SS type A sorting domain-containing protein [Aureispira sp.]